MAKAATAEVLTPVGELWFTRVAGEGKKFDPSEPKEKEKYEVNIVMTPEQFAPLKEEIDNFYEANVSEKAKSKQGDDRNVPYAKHVLKDKEGNETETDNFILKARTNRFFKDGKEKVIPVLDSKGKAYPEGYFANRFIGNGSTGRVKGVLMPWQFQNKEGITLYLNVLQLGNHVQHNAAEGMEGIEGNSSISDALPGAEAPEEEVPF